MERYDAGRDYLTAVQKLKLEPEALFWAYDKTVGHFVLALVTSLFDYVGPLALSELLFRAYNTAATPREIDPFIVRLHSPNHAIYRALQIHLSSRVDQADLKGATLDRAAIAGTVTPPGVVAFSGGDLEVFGTWVYKSARAVRRAKSYDADRRWRRFARAVHAIAA